MYLGKKYLNLVTKVPIRFYLENQSFGHTSTTELVHKGIFRKSFIRRKPLLAESYEIKLPSTAQWSSFSVELDDCSAWKWEDHYTPDSVILDGMNWKIEIEFSDGRSIHSSGCNAYPIDTQWYSFNLAINKLLGIKWLDYKN